MPNPNELMDQLCKFKIGDTCCPLVETKLPTNRRSILLVLDRYAEQCEGGVQIHYNVRRHTLREMGTWGRSDMPRPDFIGEGPGGLARLRESELVSLDLEQYAQSLSDERDSDPLNKLRKAVGKVSE
jgi:hypothetical protein